MRVCGILALYRLEARNGRKHFLPQMRDPRCKNCPFASIPPVLKFYTPGLKGTHILFCIIAHIRLEHVLTAQQRIFGCMLLGISCFEFWCLSHTAIERGMSAETQVVFLGLDQPGNNQKQTPKPIVSVPKGGKSTQHVYLSTYKPLQVPTYGYIWVCLTHTGCLLVLLLFVAAQTHATAILRCTHK